MKTYPFRKTSVQRVAANGGPALVIILIAALAALNSSIPTARAQESAAQRACAQDIFIQPGDTLSILAARHLGSLTAYAEIVDATNARRTLDASYADIADPNVLEIGWKVCIPAFGGAPAVAQSTTAGPLQTPTPVATPSPTPTATPYSAERHPLRIDVMRRAPYPGSAITIEQVLEPGIHYDRYLTSYLSDGLKIYALLTAPHGPQPASGWPAIIFNHGYIPPEVYRTTERYVAYVDAFARSGYIVFRPDYRGHGFSEGEATGGYGSPAYTVDVLNAVASVKQYPAADPDRIGMWGHSMGGHITLRSMVVTDDIKAGVIWAGVVGTYPDLLERWRALLGRTHPPAHIANRARRWREEMVTWYGSPTENPAFWAAISPNSYVSDLSGPIQLQHGTADTSVPMEFSRELFAALDAAGQVAELHTYAGDDHNISANLSTALQRSVDFFDRYVKDVGLQ